MAVDLLFSPCHGEVVHGCDGVVEAVLFLAAVALIGLVEIGSDRRLRLAIFKSRSSAEPQLRPWRGPGRRKWPRRRQGHRLALTVIGQLRRVLGVRGADVVHRGLLRDPEQAHQLQRVSGLEHLSPLMVSGGVGVVAGAADLHRRGQAQ